MIIARQEDVTKAVLAEAARTPDPRLRDIPVLVYSAVDGHGLPPDVPYLRKGSSTADQLLDMIERTIR